MSCQQNLMSKTTSVDALMGGSPLLIIKHLTILVSLGAALCGCDLSSSEISQEFKQKLYVVAANEVAEHERSIQVETPDGNKVIVNNYPIERYRSGNDLIRDNPDCCIIGSTPGEHKSPKCIGERFYVVTINFRARYRDQAGPWRKARRTRAIGVARNLKLCSSPYWR